MRQLPPTPQPPLLSRAQIVMGLYGSLALAGVLVGAYRGDANVYTLPGTVTTPIRLVASPILGFGLGLAIVLASRLAVRRYAWARMLHQDFRALLGPLGDSEIIVLALGSSIGEGVFFRGVLLPA